MAEQAFGLGVFGYVVEPLPPGQLLITTMNALRRRELEMPRMPTPQARRPPPGHHRHGPVAIFAENRSGHYAMANATAEELGGACRAGSSARPIATLMSPERAARAAETNGLVLAGASASRRRRPRARGQSAGRSRSSSSRSSTRTGRSSPSAGSRSTSPSSGRRSGSATSSSSPRAPRSRNWRSPARRRSSGWPGRSIATTPPPDSTSVGSPPWPRSSGRSSASIPRSTSCATRP